MVLPLLALAVQAGATQMEPAVVYQVSFQRLRVL